MKIVSYYKNIFKLSTRYYLFFLSVFYLLTRLVNLTLLPIFTDESIYIYWAKFIASFHSNWFISLTDGKPPLLIWIIAVLLQILPQEMYLLAGRLPSVLFGLFALIGIYKLSLLLFSSRKLSIIASFIYIILPFTLVYDRMALFDSMLSSMLIWSVYFAMLTAKTKKITNALLWGICLGLAFLSKPTAILFLGLTPICFFIYTKIKSKNDIIINLKYPIIAIVIGEVINNMQRVSSVYFMSEIKNSQFQEPVSYILSHPEQIGQNLNTIFLWMSGYYTLPILLTGVTAFIVLLSHKLKEGLVLILLCYVPIIAFAIFGRELFPRYILFIAPYFIIAFSYLVYSLLAIKYRYKWVLLALLIPLFVPLLRFDYYVVADPKSAPFPKTDYQQYIAYHTSGYGLEKVYSFIDKKSREGKLKLITQGTFGIYPYAFNLRYWDNKNVEIIPVWPFDFARNQIPEVKDNEKIYIILKEYDTLPNEYQEKLETLVKSEKPGNRYPIFLTELREK